MPVNHWLRLCRLKWIGLTTLVLCATFAFAMDGHATQHRGGNGPDGALMLYQPPSDSRFGGYVWGTVIVDGQPVAGAIVTMSYQGQPITATTLLVPEIEPFPIYMFGNRPLAELGATLNTTVTMSATYGSKTFPEREVRLTPGADQELEVSFGGSAPVMLPTPPPDPAPTLPLTGVATSHLLDAGGYHTCAVVSGAVWCWGQNIYANLGDGTMINRSTPVRANNISNAKAVAATSTHSCAILLNGKISCWGTNQYGQLGYSANPDPRLAIDTATDISVGHGSTCALLEEQRVKCFGYNALGQMGIGITETAVTTPTYVLRDKDNNLPLEKVTAIVSEDLNYCAIVDGGMWCWGQYRGSPAIGTATVPTGTLPTKVIPPNNDVISIETGYDLSCAVKGNGELWCYLFNDHPVYGLPFRQLVQIQNLPDKATKVAVGHDFYCVLLRNSSVYCAGYNDYGQLGASTPHYTETPLKVAGLDLDIVDITAEWKHACVRTSQGKVQCWGLNNSGQLGDGSAPSTTRYQPVTVNLPAQVGSKLLMGGLHACRVNSNSSLQCWGANFAGQLGLGSTSLYVLTPTTVMSMSSGVLTASAGRAHSCVIKQNGAINEVWCWGRGSEGQLGNGSLQNSVIPVIVSELISGTVMPIDLATGIDGTCALLSDGTVKCWGSPYSNVPVSIGLSAPAQQVAVGRDHTCAVLTTGFVQCWGRGTYRQLGIDSTEYRSIPVTVTNLVNATQVAAADAATCAVANGGLKCWGSFAVHLANGIVLTQTTLAENVFGLTSGVSKVQMGSDRFDLGADYACVLLTSGAVQCFGANGVGNLGIDSSATSPSPLTVTNLTSNVVDLTLSPAGMSGCAQLSNGASQCWGDNTNGQLGMGIAESKSTPVNVPGLTPAQWTYMLYLVGDNDLSSYLGNIARQLDTLPVNTALNIVVMFDGKGENDSYLWTTRKEGSYRAGVNRWKVSEATSNMGDPATLQRFIEWAHASYPAQHYYLSIADHGRATSGTGWDMQNGKLDANTKKLTPAELRLALANATYGGAWQFDILHFDSCLMGLLEMAYQVKEYTQFMIASENLTAAFYPYDRYARLVLNDPLITPRALAIDIADTYFTYDYLAINNQPRTIAVYDLSKIGPVMNAVDALASELKDKAPAQLRERRRLAQKFDASPEGTPPRVSYYTITEADEYVDLRDLADKLRDLPVSAAQSVIDLLAEDPVNGFIVFNDRESGVDRLVSGQHWELSNAHGVAIYFPVGAGGYDYADYVSHKLFAFTAQSKWTEFLQAYTAGVAPAPFVGEPGVPPVLKPTKPITEHCPGAAFCLYGAVFTNTLPVANAVVTLRLSDQVMVTTTAFITHNEAFPLFRFPLTADQVAIAERITITATYGISKTAATISLAPGQREQRVDLVFTTVITTPHQGAKPQVTVLSAAAWRSGIANGNELTFKATAVASDNSPIARYQWHSTLDGDFGNTATFTLPANRLRVGQHTITVTATNTAGITSSGLPFTHTVQPVRTLFLPLIRQ